MGNWEQGKQLLFDLLNTYDGDIKKSIQAMDSEQIKSLNTHLSYMNKRIKLIQEVTEFEHRQRKTDFEKLAADAKNKFSQLDIQILEHLHGDDERGFYSRHFENEFNQSSKAVRKSINRLTRYNLIELCNLVDYDGMVAGRGYMEVHKNYDRVGAILKSYHQKQPELMESNV